MNQNTSPSDKNNKKGKMSPMQLGITVAILLVVLSTLWINHQSGALEITMRRFERMVEQGDVSEVIVIRNQKMVEVRLREEVLQRSPYKGELGDRSGLFSSSAHYKITVTTIDSFMDRFQLLEDRLASSGKDSVDYKVEERSDLRSFFLNYGVIIFLILLFWFVFRRMAGGVGGGGQIFNIGKSRAALFDRQNKVTLTFEDVASLEEAKEELKEIVDFLRMPSKFTKLGGKIPKGALLVGAPGTGKTLLAKAVAGEAEVPFFSLSGSDFVEMFVGVGAARVRDLFKQAKEKAPCIIFIDEVDAIGRSRGRGQVPGQNDERENTLNSLLVEMDGFSTNSGVIILAATNRPDVLDHALMRPGRFDRQISIDKPDIKGREDIFKVHLKNICTNKGVDVSKLSAQTPGFAGAEIANVCNEAALIAARQDKATVSMGDFQSAIDRIIGGLEKKNKIISQDEKCIVAYHEAGHAIVGWFLEHADPLLKVSIVPRGVAALGYAQYLPKEQFLYQTEQLMDEMSMTLGGRASEQLIFGKISTGALSDLERVTKMAYSMVSMYGMNEQLGPISFHESSPSEYSFNKPYSEHTAQIIDKEVQKLVDKAYLRAYKLLIVHKEELEKIAKVLLKKEILFKSDLERLIGKRSFDLPKPSPKKPRKKVPSALKVSQTQSNGEKPKKEKAPTKK